MKYIEEHKFFEEEEISQLDACKLFGKNLEIMVLDNGEFVLIIGKDTSTRKKYLLRKIDTRKSKEPHLIMKYDNSNLDCLRANYNIPESTVEKPTKGVMPRFLWDEKRLNQLKECISVKILNNEKLSFEWVEEYNDLIK